MVAKEYSQTYVLYIHTEYESLGLLITARHKITGNHQYAAFTRNRVKVFLLVSEDSKC